MPANTIIQVRRGSSAQWSTADSENRKLAAGEIGYDTTLKKFKIGDGITSWASLPWAGGMPLIAGSGIGIEESTTSYTIHSKIETTGNGIVLSSVNLPGDGTANKPSGSYYNIALDERLQQLSNLNSSGIIVGTNSSGVSTIGLNAGANILISNPSGISSGSAANPIISLTGNITGISSISGVDGWSLYSASGINIDAGIGKVTVNDLDVNGSLYVGQGIDISLAASIIASQSIVYSGNPTVFSGNVYFDQTPYVGITGGTLGTNLWPVSKSGHQHVYTDVTDFETGVATYVDTALVGGVGSGIQTIFNGSNTLSLALSGQALNLHTHNQNGLLVRQSDGTFASRTIESSNSNIVIGSGDGTAGNPVIGLANNLSVNDLTLGGNLIVGGSTIIANVSTVNILDPIINVGGSGIVSGDTKDRGLQISYQTGNTVAKTGFMGYDYSTGYFTALTDATNTNEVFTGTKAIWDVGGVLATGLVSGSRVSGTLLLGDGGGITGIYANNIASGTISSDRLSGTYTININGSATSVTNSLTISSNGAGDSSGSTYNGSAAKTISYNSIGAPSVNGTNAAGTWNIGISGNAATVTNGVYTSRNINTSNGLTGGGNLSADRTLSVVAGTGIIVNTGVHVDTSSVVMTTGTQTINGAKTFNDGISLKTTSASSTNGFGVFEADPTGGTARVLAYRSLANIRSDLGTSTSTADRLVLRDSNADFASRQITVSGISGSLTWDSKTAYHSVSISGVNNATYLVNFIVDGGTP